MAVWSGSGAKVNFLKWYKVKGTHVKLFCTSVLFFILYLSIFLRPPMFDFDLKPARIFENVSSPVLKKVYTGIEEIVYQHWPNHIPVLAKLYQGNKLALSVYNLVNNGIQTMPLISSIYKEFSKKFLKRKKLFKPRQTSIQFHQYRYSISLIPVYNFIFGKF